MKDQYDDIINLPHHVSKTRPQMSMVDRAAQFSPFAALTGYGFSGTMDVGNIRDRLTKPMPLLKKRSLVNRIVDFIGKHAEKYQ